MTKKEKFDLQIKNLLKHDDFGYYAPNGKIYDSYYRKQVFDGFVKEMREKYKSVYKSYSEGNGGELKEGKRYPPKMASVASSSRFIYLTLRDDYLPKLRKICSNISDSGKLTFEDKKLKVNLINRTPNLDASYITDVKSIYIESKCHELFDSHLLRWKNGYFQNGIFFGTDKKSLQIPEKYVIESFKDVEHKMLNPSVFNINADEHLFLDIKQFVCHLLGIVNDTNLYKELIYLYFKPNNLVNFEEEYLHLEKQFNSFCTSEYISSFCKRNNIHMKLVYATNNTMYEEFRPEIRLNFY